MRRLAFCLCLPAAVACMEGPDTDTLVDDVRVVAIRSTPPEASPGDDVDFDLLVSDPRDAGVEVLFWHCTPLGDGCLEEGSEHVWSPPLVDEQATVTTTVPMALAPVATEEPVRATLLWALACDPGVCPQIPDPTGYDLAAPTDWLRDLPMEGVALAFDTLAISTRDQVSANPVVTREDDDPLAVEAGEPLTLAFQVALDVPATVDTLAHGYATGGGFDATEYAIGEDGAVELTWYAPEEPGEVRLYVVAIDGAGGLGFWTGTATAE